MTDRDTYPMITSIDMLKITGISRATLNNYITMGLLPKPMVRKVDDPHIRARKVGYFPETVLDSIKSIKAMKAEGRSMKHIVETLKDRPMSPASEAVDQKKNDDPITEKLGEKRNSSQEELFPEMEKKREEHPAKNSKGRCLTNKLTVTVDDFRCPAYLVNSKFEIDWINEQAEKEIFKENIHDIRPGGQRNIFRLLFNGQFIKDEKERTALVDIHMRFFKVKCLRSYLSRLYDGITDKQLRILEYLYDLVAPSSQATLQRTYVSLPTADGSEITYQLYRIMFREGVLFAFVDGDAMNRGIAERMCCQLGIFNDILKQRKPTLISYCVLVAELQAFDRISAELPAEKYFSLLNDIWTALDITFKKYYGTYGNYKGNGIVYYFFVNKNSNYLTNALSCALEIRETLSKLSLHLKLSREGFGDLQLNMGINEGEDYFGVITDSPRIELNVLGDTVSHAALLAEIAPSGSIWTTKNLINKLTGEELSKIRFGIRRIEGNREIFYENRFCRIKDLFSTVNPDQAKFFDIDPLAVTEILDGMPRSSDGEKA
jgi:adenylate cyclase